MMNQREYNNKLKGLRRSILIQIINEQYNSDPKKWLTEEDIIKRVNEEVYFQTFGNDEYRKAMYKMCESNRSHCLCPRINEDVEIINNDINKNIIIVCDNCMYKRATREEAEEYKQKLYKRALKKLYRVSRINDKIRSDGAVIMDYDEFETRAMEVFKI